MPLPANGTAWPPNHLRHIHAKFAEWDAWWVGDIEGLESAYGRRDTSAARVRPSQMAGGVVGTVARMFWGRPQLDLTQPRTKLHIPIATDLCQASSDLLWSESPTITVGEAVVGEDGKPGRNATQDRLDELLDDQAMQAFAEGSEAGAAHGGHFLRVTWDEAVQPDGPFISVVHADAADPEFRWGRLVAVTFWSVVKREGQQVWRHVERHETQDGVGVILHGLYLGTRDNLGRAVPLADSSATKGLDVDADSAISTESPGLAVVYVPNQRPQRRWRTDPAGKDLGRSDLDGVEGPMDALDEAWSSWMRDIRIGKGRIFVSQAAASSNGLGKGASIDLDQEVFTEVGAPPTSAANASSLVQAEQFKIRHEEHKATVDALVDVVLRTAGYSPSTFGRGGDGTMKTAREVTVDQQRSLLTRDRKLRAVRPALSVLLEKLLAVDVAIFGTTGVTVARPSVEFPDGVQESLLELAQTASALRLAEAASTRVLVQMVHPEWDDQQVDDEVELILDEKAAATPPLPDPTDPALVDGAVPQVEPPA